MDWSEEGTDDNTGIGWNEEGTDDINGMGRNVLNCRARNGGDILRHLTFFLLNYTATF